MNHLLTEKVATHFKPKDASYEVRDAVARGHILHIVEGPKNLRGYDASEPALPQSAVWYPFHFGGQTGPYQSQRS